MTRLLLILPLLLALAALQSASLPFSPTDEARSGAPQVPAAVATPTRAGLVVDESRPNDGSETSSSGGVPLPTVAVPAVIPPSAPRYRGTATWYCLSGSSVCTRGYGPSDLVAAIDSDLGFAKGDRIVVRYGKRSVTVRVVDVCACPGERLVDLTSGAFSRLAPLGYGVIPVTVEAAGPGMTLPPTDAP